MGSNLQRRCAALLVLAGMTLSEATFADDGTKKPTNANQTNANQASPSEAGANQAGAELTSRNQADQDPKIALAKRLDAEFRTNTETRDQSNENRVLADRFEKVLSNFVEIGGYFRAGYGRSSAGGPMSAFQAPGAAAKYRLGNEAENYGELIFAKNFYLPGVFHVDDELHPDGELSGPIARVQVRLNFLNPYSAFGSSEATLAGLPEAWASIGNVLPFAPSVKVWAGNRFYRRHDIHVNDFYYWNMSGGGGGIEDIPLGPARLAIAWIGWGSTSGLSYVPTPDPQNQAGFSKSSFDLRVYDLPLLFGKAELGLTFSHARSGLDESGRQGPDSQGVAAVLVHTIPKFISDDGSNKFSIQYGTGPAKTFTAGFETVTLAEGTFIAPDENSAARLRITESFSANVGEHFTLGPVLIFQYTTTGTANQAQTWVSAGVRPVYNITRHIGIAAEGGMDFVNDEATGSSGTLGKLTLCPQVSVGNRWASRPVIRAFVTGAFWSSAFRGRVGGADFANATDGVNGGVQMESWW
jgi:maltoporin